MLRPLLFAFAAVLVACSTSGCRTNPHPFPSREKNADGSPWTVRYFGLLDDPRALDPQHAYDQMSRQVIEPIYDCMLEYHPLKTDPYELVPCMLEAVPKAEKQADGSVIYACKLKPGILYHDDPCFPGGKGREVVAEDIHFAFQRMCDPKVECPVVGPLSDYVKGMREVYDQAKKTGNPYAMRVSGIEVLDTYSFKIHLVQPYPQILYWMAMNFTSPVAKESTDYYNAERFPKRKDFRWHPVGHGPFRLAEYHPSHRARLVRNEKYHTTTFPTGDFPADDAEYLKQFAGKPLPLVDEIEMPVIRELQTIWLLTKLGYLDLSAVQKDAFSRVLTPSKTLSPDLEKRGMTLDKDVEPSTFFISFNASDPVLSNKKLRQALSCAFDSQKWVDIFYNGVPLVAQQLVPPGLFGHDKTYRNPYGPNLEKAKKLLAEAGYPGGIDPKTGKPLEITLDVAATGSTERQMAEFDRDQFEQIGVRIKVVENTFAKLLEKEDRGNFQMCSGTGWGADYPDPENFFFLFYSKNVPPVGKNISWYKSAEFDAAFEQMALMENGPERLAICEKMRDIMAEDCPVIYSFHKAYYVMVQPWSRRTHRNLMLERGLKYLPIDHALREKCREEWNRPTYWPLGLVALLIAGAVFYAINWNRKLNA